MRPARPTASCSARCSPRSFTGLAAPAVGTYLVQRRLALMGDGIGHVAVTGVALGLLTGTSPTWTAVVVAILGAVAHRGDPRARAHQRRRRAGAAVLRRPRRRRAAHRAGRPERRARCSTYLFGSITTISVTDVLRHDGAGRGGRRGRCVGLAPQLFAVAQDQEFARVAGLNVRVYNLLVAVLAAVSVTVAMRTVGLLLVSRADGGAGRDRAAAHPRRSAPRSPPRWGSACWPRVGGLLIAAFASTAPTSPPAPTIVLLALAGFAVDLAGRRLAAPPAAAARAVPRAG